MLFFWLSVFVLAVIYYFRKRIMFLWHFGYFNEWMTEIADFLAPFLPILVAVLFSSWMLWKLPQWQIRKYRSRFNPEDIEKLEPKDRIQLEKDLLTTQNTLRTTLAQILGGLFVLVGLYSTWESIRISQENLKITEEGKITDRFSKAVEMLGSTNLDVRLGGIYALERIASDSPKDHWTAIEVLTAFIREHAKISDQTSTSSNTAVDAKRKDLMSRITIREILAASIDSTAPSDIQAALTALGRRKFSNDEEVAEGDPLKMPQLTMNLNRVNLAGASFRLGDFRYVQLEGGNLEAADLTGVKMDGAFLRQATLKGAILIVESLKGASLTGANLEGAWLSGNCSEAKLNEANLKGAILVQVNLEGAYLEKANLEGANLRGANLLDATGLTWEQLSKADIDDRTKLPPDLKAEWEREKQKRK